MYAFIRISKFMFLQISLFLKTGLQVFKRISFSNVKSLSRLLNVFSKSVMKPEVNPRGFSKGFKIEVIQVIFN